jgi:hypothetical protein
MSSYGVLPELLARFASPVAVEGDLDRMIRMILHSTLDRRERAGVCSL